MRRYIKNNAFQFFLCIYSVIYLGIVMLFLNGVYMQGQLFTWQNIRGIKLYFSQDVFDMFWLILAAIPNGVFSLLLFKDLFVTPSGSRKFLYCATFFAGIIFFILSYSVKGHTGAFNNNPGVWSSKLLKTTEILYICLEMISTFIISIEIANVICGIIYFLNLEKKYTTTAKDSLLRIFVSSVILATYWFMLILSGIVNDKYLNKRKGTPPLFPTEYYLIGLAVIFFVAVCFFIYLEYSGEKAEVLKTIITSAIIPGIPITIQILQIIFPAVGS